MATEFVVNLDTRLPPRLAVGRGTALFVRGSCIHYTRRIRELSVAVDDSAHRAMAHSMPSSDGSGGFWGIVPFEPPPREIELAVLATLDGGGQARAPLGTIRLDPWPSQHEDRPRAEPGAGPLVAICMATFDPPTELLERQIESIRQQTHRDWICLISDDRSAPDRFTAIERAVGDDDRFTISRAERRLGFYRNFERALSMVPESASFVALADQDDRWHPEKLEALLGAIGDAQLAYSDGRVVAPNGRLASHTFWTRRRNNHTNLASLLLANTVTGASSLFRRDLLPFVLPLPPAPGRPYHDHWIALVALARGELRYVDRALFDYVQHPAAMLGHAAIDPAPGASRLSRLRRLIADPSGALERWRGAYFEEYCRTMLFARVLTLRCRDELTAPKRRGLDRLLAGERSPRSIGWLAARPARRLAGRNETLGFEHWLLRGIAWRHLAGRWPASRSRAPRATDRSPPT